MLERSMSILSYRSIFASLSIGFVYLLTLKLLMTIFCSSQRCTNRLSVSFSDAFSPLQRDLNADWSPSLYLIQTGLLSCQLIPPLTNGVVQTILADIGTAKGKQLIRLLGGPGTVPPALLEFKPVWRLHRLSLILSPHLMLHTDMTLNYVYNMSMRFSSNTIFLLPVLYTVCIYHLAFWLMIEFCSLHLCAIHTVHEHTHTHTPNYTHKGGKLQMEQNKKTRLAHPIPDSNFRVFRLKEVRRARRSFVFKHQRTRATAFHRAFGPVLAGVQAMQAKNGRSLLPHTPLPQC